MHSSSISARPNHNTSCSPPAVHTQPVDGAAALLGYDDVVADDEGDDICPVCDGECTCANTRSQPDPSRCSTSSSPHKPLKIKLIVPATMLPKHHQPMASSSKHQLGASNDDDPPSVESHTQHHHHAAQSQSKAYRRRGRPPKKSHHAAAHTPQPSTSTRPKITKHSAKKSKSVTATKAPRTFAQSKRPQTGRYPTFLPASAIASVSSDSSDGSDSLSSLTSSDEIDSDGSMQHEEEQFIRNEEENAIYEKARVRRELLGDDQNRKRKWFRNGGGSLNNRKEPITHAPSLDDNLTGDSSSDDAADEADEEEVGDDDDEEESDANGNTRARYVGFATGWSDDEESCFDADLFFAGLSDDSSDDEVARVDNANDQLTPPGPIKRGGSNLSVHSAMHAEFEVAENWDGQIVFTNGAREMRHHHHPMLYIHDESVPPSSDISMTSEGDDAAETSHLTEEADGETTEEELVGADGLPNESAMQLFSLPSFMSSSNIIHLQTLSSEARNSMVMSRTNSSDSVSRPKHMPPGPQMRGFSHNVRTHPAHIVIDTSISKDVIPRPYFQFREERSHATRERSWSIDSSTHLSSPGISMMELHGDAIEVDLDDFLNDTTCSDSESAAPTLSPFASTATDSESILLDQNLHRWDLISIGTFRTREATAFVLPTSPVQLDNTSSLNATQDHELSSPYVDPSPQTPVKKPVRSLSSPCTPDSLSSKRTPEREPKIRTHHTHPREPRKLKKPKYRNVHHQYHRHLHHPNMKKRGTISVQRINFSAASTSSLS